uniref:Uncharacterized protein n=1 Tax=viral metagenome TaxID=1070528 RepID=A0A6C0ADS5_9ZZZZ
MGQTPSTEEQPPTQPVVQPTQPIYQPTQPPYQPTQPIYQPPYYPTQPVVQPPPQPISQSSYLLSNPAVITITGISPLQGDFNNYLTITGNNFEYNNLDNINAVMLVLVNDPSTVFTSTEISVDLTNILVFVSTFICTNSNNTSYIGKNISNYTGRKSLTISGTPFIVKLKDINGRIIDSNFTFSYK